MVLIITVGIVIILLGVYVAVKKRTKPLDKNTLKMLYINYLCKDFEGDSKFLMNPMGQENQILTLSASPGWWKPDGGRKEWNITPEF